MAIASYADGAFLLSFYLTLHGIRIDLTHVGSGVLFADVFDDQLPLAGPGVFHRDPRIVGHHRQVNGLNGFRVRLHPTHLHTQKHKLSPVRRGPVLLQRQVDGLSC